MEKAAIEDVENQPNPLDVHDVRRPISRTLGTDHFAMNYFELAPGETFSGGLHTHRYPEELFYVESRSATFEVGRERETVVVEAGEPVRFAPGKFRTGRNHQDEGQFGFTCEDCGTSFTI